MQQMRRRIIYSIFLIRGFLWIFISADKTGTSTSGRTSAPQEGFLAADFELKTPAGENVKLSFLR